jgi:hypothetical protein
MDYDEEPEDHVVPVDHVWAHFEYMLPDGALPVHGWQILVFVDEHGHQGVQIMTAGEPAAVDTIGYMGYATQLLTIPEMLGQVQTIHHYHEHGEGDGEGD